MKIRIRQHSFLAVCLAYLGIPVIIFAFGALRIWWAVILLLLLAVPAVLIVRNIRKEHIPGGKDDTCISLKMFLAAFALISVWVYFGGIGEFSWTTADHPYRAAILNDLIDYKWPVVYDMSRQAGALRGMTGMRALAYYYTFWTVPALAGKMFGITAARAVLVLWSVTGLMLVFTGICTIQKKPSFTALLMMIIFSTFDFIPLTVMDILNVYDGSWEGWNLHLNIHSNTFQIMNVFNQSIPGWLAAVLLLKYRDCRIIAFTGGMTFCYSPWGAVGMVPVAVYYWIFGKDGKRNRIKDMFSVCNILPAAGILLFIAPFYMLNTLTKRGWTVTFYKSTPAFILSLILYAVFEAGIWFLLLWPYRKKDNSILYDRKLFIATAAVFVFLPFYLVGGFTHDLLMRGSLIPFFILTVMSVLKLDEIVAPVRSGDHLNIKSAGFLLTYFLAALTPIMLIVASVAGTVEMYKEYGFDNPDRYPLGSFGNVRDEEYADGVKDIFLSDNYEDTLFFRYLARE